MRERAAIGNNHLRLSLLTNFILIVSYPLLFASYWFVVSGQVDADVAYPEGKDVTFYFSILKTSVVYPPSPTITHLRTSTFLEDQCLSLVPLMCQSLVRLNTCFVVWLAFKMVSVMLSMTTALGLVYLLIKNQFDESVYT